jgi:hypothetical protein
MSNDSSADAPDAEPVRQTYGELRRQLADNGNPWTVDPLISDDEPLPEFPLGGLPEDVGERVVGTKLDAEVDIRELIAELPPNDLGLRRRWAEAGMPLDRIPSALTGDRVEEEVTQDPEQDGPRNAS